MTSDSDGCATIAVGGARLDLTDVQFQDDLVIDEVHLEGGDIRIQLSAGAPDAGVTAGETRVRAVMSEANLNRFVTASLPDKAPVRGLHIALLSGKARVSGKALISILPFPFSIEAIPRVENGVRVLLDCRSATLGIDLPRAVVEILEQKVNDALSLDVSRLDIPIWIDEVRCEPGRLTAVGRARFSWPPAAAGGSEMQAPGNRSLSAGLSRDALVDAPADLPALSAAPPQTGT